MNEKRSLWTVEKICSKTNRNPLRKKNMIENCIICIPKIVAQSISKFLSLLLLLLLLLFLLSNLLLLILSLLTYIHIYIYTYIQMNIEPICNLFL